MSKGMAEKKQASKEADKKEEESEEDESSKDETTKDAATPSAQTSSPSVTLSSLHQYPSLPNATTPPPTESPSKLIAAATAAPEDGNYLPPSSPLLPAPSSNHIPPPTIITAEDETPSTNLKVTSSSGQKDSNGNNKEGETTSSLKLYKNTPGKPKESIFETKHPNLHAVDKDYLKKLIEIKEKYEKLEKAHKRCVSEDDAKKREKKARTQEKEKHRKADEARNKLHQRNWRRTHSRQVKREDKIRGIVWIDSLSESERYGPKDPMKYTFKRLKTMNPKLHQLCERAVKQEREEAKVPFSLMGEKVYPIRHLRMQGQKWVTLCPLWGMIRPHGERTLFTVVNFTDRHMEIKIRITGADNFMLAPKITVLNPNSYEQFQLLFLKRRVMRRPDEMLTIYFNDLEDMNKMRKEFGKDKIDITKHFAGKITVGVFVQNWELKYEQRPNRIDHDCREGEKRAVIYVNDSRHLANYKYKESPTPSENNSKNGKDDTTEESKNSKVVDRRDRSNSDSSKKRREKEKKEKKKDKEKKKENEEEKKNNRRKGLIKADKNTSFDIKDGEKTNNNASVSREMSKEWAKTKK